MYVVSAFRRARAGADMEVKTPGTGYTPLHLAVLGGNAAAAKTLIMAGADVNVLDAEHDSPLHLAIKGGHVEIAKDLLLTGANANLVGSTESFRFISRLTAAKTR